MSDFNRSTLDRVATAAGVSSEEDISINVTQESSSPAQGNDSTQTAFRLSHAADWVDREGIVHTVARTQPTGVLTDDPSATGNNNTSSLTTKCIVLGVEWSSKSGWMRVCAFWG